MQGIDFRDFKAVAKRLEATLIGELSPTIKQAIRTSDQELLRNALPNLALRRSRTQQNFQLVARALRYLAQVSKKRSLPLMLQLLPNSADLPVTVDDNGWNVAHHSCSIHRNADVVAALAEHCAEAFVQKDHKGLTPVHIACSKLESVELLVEKFPDMFEQADSSGGTPVHSACRRSSQQQLVLQLLETFPRSVRHRDSQGQNAVHVACKHQRTVAVHRRLIDDYADCFLEKDHSGHTPLHLLLENQVDLNVMKQLMNEKFLQGFGEQDDNGQTPIHIACMHQQDASVIRLLVENFTDAFLQADTSGRTPIHCACTMQRSSKVLELLICKFNSSGIFDDDGNDVSCGIRLACSSRHIADRPKVVRVLSDHFLEYFFDAQSGLAVLCLLAESFGQTEQIVEQLQVSSMDGSSPLHAACTVCTEEFVQFLFKALPLSSFAIVDADGRTPIDVAEINDGKHKAIVHSLLQQLHAAQAGEASADGAIIDCLARLNIGRCVPNQVAKQTLKQQLRFGQYSGETLLHFVCLYGHSANIQHLINLGWNLAITNDAGKSCLDFAFEKGQQEVVFEACESKSLQMLTLLDPATHVLRQPDFEPQEVMESYSIFSSSKSDSVEMHMLRRALQLDDSVLFRSLLMLEKLSDECLLAMMQILRTDPAFKDFCRKPLDTVGDPIDAALDNDRVNIVFDYVISRQTDLIPTCLRFLIQMQHRKKLKLGKHEQLHQLEEKLTAVAVNALDELFYQATEQEKQLLFRYMSAEFQLDGELGPKFSYLQLDDCWHCYSCLNDHPSGSKVTCSVFEMIEAAGVLDLFGTGCVRKYIDHMWVQPTGLVFAPKSTACCMTYRNKFYLHFAAFIAVLVFLAWYIADFNSTLSYIWPDLVVVSIFLSLLLLECLDFYTRSHFVSKYFYRVVIRAPLYCMDNLNVYDILAIASLATGLSLKFWIRFDARQDTAGILYASQMSFATAYLLLGFRTVYLLSYFEAIGPMISMIKKLLIKDLLPFMALISAILVSFGVFFFSLLRLNCEQNKPYYRILTIPAFMLFGYFEKDFEDNEPPGSTNSTTEARLNSVGKNAFDYIFFFLFLGLVNIVMLNLLIALFSESVKSVKSQSFTLWRKSRWHMLREYQRSCLLPPPLTVLEFVVWAVVFASRHFASYCSRCSRCSGADDSRGRSGENVKLQSKNSGDWWHQDVQHHPKEYKDFLKFQASVFRRCRADLTDKIVSNRDDTAALLAAAENQSDSMQSHLDKEILQLKAAQRRQTAELQQQLHQLAGTFNEQLQASCKQLTGEILCLRLQNDERARCTDQKLKKLMDESFHDFQLQMTESMIQMRNPSPHVGLSNSST